VENFRFFFDFCIFRFRSFAFAFMRANSSFPSSFLVGELRKEREREKSTRANTATIMESGGRVGNDDIEQTANSEK